MLYFVVYNIVQNLLILFLFNLFCVYEFDYKLDLLNT